MRDRPDGPDGLASDVKRDQQAFFGCRNDWHQIWVTPFEMLEQQSAILIEHVSTGAEVARGPTSHVRIPHPGDSWPIKPFAANVGRFAVPCQQAQASGVALCDDQDCFSQCLKYGGRR